MQEYMIQLTAGRGPEECTRVVARVLEILLKEARDENLRAEVADSVPGDLNGTLRSALVRVGGEGCQAFVGRWQGTIQWVAQSPYRKFHRRKNWFVGVQAFNVTSALTWDARQVTFESMRASGPGGQHVNKTESAVRARHLPSGITVVASERRSQAQNRAAALERLKDKVMQWYAREVTAGLQEQWEQHHALVRGNPIRTFQERL